MDQRGDIFGFLESRIYDRENINVLLLLQEDCLLRFVKEVKYKVIMFYAAIIHAICRVISMSTQLAFKLSS